MNSPSLIAATSLFLGMIKSDKRLSSVSSAVFHLSRVSTSAVTMTTAACDLLSTGALAEMQQIGKTKQTC